MDTLFTIALCSLVQLITYTASMAAFAAVDPIGAVDCYNGYKDPGTFFGRLQRWPLGVVRLARYWPLATITEIGGYITILLVFGPIIMLGTFVLNQVLVQLLVPRVEDADE